MDRFVSGETTFKYNPMTSEEVSVTVNNVTNMVNSFEDRLKSFETQTTTSINVLHEMAINNYSSLYDTINEKTHNLDVKIMEERRSLEFDINYMNDKLSHMYQFLSWFFSPLLHLLLSPIGQLWNYITGSYIVNVEVNVLNITDEGEPIQRKYLVRQILFLDKSVYSRKKRLQVVRENHPKWKKEWKKLKKEKPVVPMDTKSIVQFI